MSKQKWYLIDCLLLTGHIPFRLLGLLFLSVLATPEVHFQPKRKKFFS